MQHNEILSFTRLKCFFLDSWIELAQFQGWNLDYPAIGQGQVSLLKKQKIDNKLLSDVQMDLRHIITLGGIRLICTANCFPESGCN